MFKDSNNEDHFVFTKGDMNEYANTVLDLMDAKRWAARECAAKLEKAFAEKQELDIRSNISELARITDQLDVIRRKYITIVNLCGWEPYEGYEIVRKLITEYSDLVTKAREEFEKLESREE